MRKMKFYGLFLTEYIARSSKIGLFKNHNHKPDIENKCPQIVSRSPPVVSEENPMRISCRSITSGTLGFNNGDFVVTVYIVIDTSKYKGLPALGTNIPSLIIK